MLNIFGNCVSKYWFVLVLKVNFSLLYLNLISI